jgi:hypothetical protein
MAMLSGLCAAVFAMRPAYRKSVAAIGVLVFAGCAADLDAGPRVPAALVDKAGIDSLPNVRFWGDSKPGSYGDLARQRIEIVRR